MAANNIYGLGLWAAGVEMDDISISPGLSSLAGNHWQPRPSAHSANAGNPEEPTQRHSKHGEIENCPYKAFLETGDIGSDSLYVDIPAITRMAGVINHLKDNNGFLGNLSEWMNDLLPAFPISLDAHFGEDDVRRAAVEFSEFSCINEQFHKLSKCMESIRLVAEQRLKAAQLRTGLASLPNEILTSVLCLASQCEGRLHDSLVHRTHHRGAGITKCTFLSATRLSHVCDRFRRVLLRTPEIWSGISDDMSLEMIEISLIRSGSTMPLNVSLDDWPNSGAFPKFYKEQNLTRLLSLTSCRWKCLSFTSSMGRRTERRFSLADLHLPLLTTLDVTFPADRLRSHSHMNMGILQGWRAPNLQLMTIKRFMPPPFQHPTSLRCLHIELVGEFVTRSATLDTQALGNFLRSCPSLVDLKLQVADVQFVNNPPRISPFCLSHVETVSLGFLSCNATVINGVLEEVRFPSASYMDLSFGLHPNSNTLLAHMTRVFVNDSVFPAVTRLKLTLSCHKPEFGMPAWSRTFGPISIPFSLLGGVHDLTLTITGLGKVSPPASDVHVPQLRSLRLQQCDSIDLQWLFGTLEKLEMQGDLSKMGFLSTNGCNHIRDVDVKYRSIPQETIINYLKAEFSWTQIQTQEQRIRPLHSRTQRAFGC